MELLTDEEIDSFQLPDDFEFILENEELNNRTITNGISLLWAPLPFDQKCGKMRRCFDITLVSPWFKEKCPSAYPVKVRVSYQKLLKNWILNALHKHKPKA